MGKPFLSSKEWMFILVLATVSFLWNLEPAPLARYVGQFGGGILGAMILYLAGRWLYRRENR